MNGGLAAPLLRAVMRSGMLRDLIARLVAYVVALVLLATAFGFLVATIYLALAKVVEAPLASLALGGVAGLILLSVRYRRRRKPTAGTVGADALLLSITEQVRRDPWLSLAIAAVLGALTEISLPSSKRPPA